MELSRRSSQMGKLINSLSLYPLASSIASSLYVDFSTASSHLVFRNAARKILSAMGSIRISRGGDSTRGAGRSGTANA
jgi:hypothetical protein